MPRALLPALIALCLLTACATSTPLLPQPMPAQQLPSECLMACPALPALTTADEVAGVIWTFDVIDAAGACRRMHDTCRAAANN